MVELYLHSQIRLHDMLLDSAQGQLLSYSIKCDILKLGGKNSLSKYIPLPSEGHSRKITAGFSVYLLLPSVLVFLRVNPMAGLGS
jgi:hypothetical protein